MSRVHRISLALLAVALLSIVPKAHAQWAVVDVGAIAQLVEQLATLQEQLDTMRNQLNQARQQYQSITGRRGMEQLLTGTVRNYLPPDWQALEAAINGAQANYAALSAQLQATVNANAILTPQRISIHRVFETLDTSFIFNRNISALLHALVRGTGNAVLSTNWDIVLEKHLQIVGATHDYVIPVELVRGTPLMGERRLKVLKLHGSSNWCYCDDCHRLFAYSIDEGKGTYKAWLFLEKRDFVALIGEERAKELIDWNDSPPTPECRYCGVRLSARVATFSFDKALGFFQFQGVWEAALHQLRSAQKWIFIGYSLPEADFELRHLLKVAQLAGRPQRPLEIEVVLGDDLSALSRYQRFFGSRITSHSMEGFDAWWEKSSTQLAC